jgi:hypothetical protein
MISKMPATIPPRKLILTWLFAPIKGRLPNNIPTLTGVFPKLYIVTVYFPFVSGLNVVKSSHLDF